MKNLLWICALLLMLAGCSSNDDITINDENILGYWENTDESEWGTGGLIFTPDGEIKAWDYSIHSGDDSGPRTYSEQHWGYFWLDDTGTLNIQNRPKDSGPNFDELHYKVMSLTKDRLVIRIFGGFGGTPLEKGTDVVYKKISNMCEQSGLTGKWDLVEVQNGPSGFCIRDYANQYPSGTVIIDLMENGKIVFNYNDGETETLDYLIPENQEQYGSIYPVILIREIPFSYEIEGSRLKLHYLGMATCDHIPATFVFKRIR